VEPLHLLALNGAAALLETLATIKPKDDFGTKNQRTPAVLMSMMVLGMIDGFTDTKADRSPQALESTPAMESQPLAESLYSLAVSGLRFW
jgi:hypothetical protein